MLQVYAKQHAHVGYRQGMHELISYCLMAIEKDMLVNESSQQEPTELLRPEFLRHDAFGIFEAIMQQLGQAYDVKTSTNAESPMEHMAKSVLLYIRDACGEMALYQRLISLNCPPELYCTRWLRLLFSREVQGYNNVLLLWDIFFDLCSTAQCPLTSLSPSRYTRPGVTPPLKLGNFQLMVVLEATAASMILLQRASLLNTEEGNEADAIHRLMNVLPLKNILPLTATLLSLMRRIQLKEEKKVLPSPSPLADGARKSSFTFTEMAQSALISADQSFRNIFNNATAAVSTQTDSNTQTLKREMLDFSQRPDSSLSRSTDSLAEIDHGALARQLNDALPVVTQYLMEMENKTAPPCKTPEMVWVALDQIDEVRKMLLEAGQSPADQSNRTSSI
jgi:TBC1 domain family protein 5